jgi:uncharacterized protein YjbI with pentapeptide repeats
MVKYQQVIFGFLVALALFIFPLSADAASSSSIMRSAGNEFTGRDFSGQKLVGNEYTNIRLENTNFSNADLRGVVFNGSVLEDANLHGVDFSEGISYLVSFKNTDLSDAILTNAMMLRSVFNNVNVTGADFTNAVLDGTEIKKLCVNASGVNPKTGVSTRESLGCKN